MRPVLLVLTATLLLCSACSGDDEAPAALPSVGVLASPSEPSSAPSPSEPSSAPSPSEPSSAASPLPSVSPSAASSPAAVSPSPDPVQGGEGQGGVVLGGTELGVTTIGTDFRTAVTRISAVLGDPSEDPKDSVSCIGVDREVAWQGFGVASKNGKLAGWFSLSPTLQTPAGVTVGTDVSTLKRVYGDSVRFVEPNPDTPATFSVQGVDVLGGLTSLDDSGSVTSLFTSACAGP